MAKPKSPEKVEAPAVQKPAEPIKPVGKVAASIPLVKPVAVPAKPISHRRDIKSEQADLAKHPKFDKFKSHGGN